MPGLGDWLDEFWQLDTERQIGMSVGRIPISKIKEVAAQYGAEAQVFITCIRAMDSAYLKAVTPSKKGEHRIMKKPLSPGMLKDSFNVV